VEATFTLDEHLDGDTLEEYAFRRLSEGATEALEEHLLICEACQEALAEVDEFVQLMKEATAQLASSRSSFELRWPRSRWGRAGIGVSGLAIVLLAALAFWPSRRAPARTVQLVALRGDDTATIAHARGGPLDLVIDVSDLPGVAKFRLELVNAAGRRQWDGEANPVDGKLTVLLPKALGRGAYWVRLSGSDGELLREFGLRSD
jgi:hypothetical protein